MLEQRKVSPSMPAGKPATAGWTKRLAMPSAISVAGMVVIFAGWGATEAWFRLQEASVTKLSGWRFKQPTGNSHFKSVEQPTRVRGELRYDFHSGGSWRDEADRRWVAHYFRWEPGRNVVGAVLVHDPRVCLGASGKQLVQILPEVRYEIDDVIVPFDAYWFKDRGEDVYVFNCVVEDVSPRPGLKQDASLALTVSSRLEAVMTGRRDRGQRRLEVAVWGASNADEARQSFSELLRRQLIVEEIPVESD